MKSILSEFVTMGVNEILPPAFGTESTIGPPVAPVIEILVGRDARLERER
jgi:hypothetical protein